MMQLNGFIKHYKMVILKQKRILMTFMTILPILKLINLTIKNGIKNMLIMKTKKLFYYDFAFSYILIFLKYCINRYPKLLNNKYL